MTGPDQTPWDREAGAVASEQLCPYHCRGSKGNVQMDLTPEEYLHALLPSSSWLLHLFEKNLAIVSLEASTVSKLILGVCTCLSLITASAPTQGIQRFSTVLSCNTLNLQHGQACYKYYTFSQYVEMSALIGSFSITGAIWSDVKIATLSPWSMWKSHSSFVYLIFFILVIAEAVAAQQANDESELGAAHKSAGEASTSTHLQEHVGNGHLGSQPASKKSKAKGNPPIPHKKDPLIISTEIC